VPIVSTRAAMHFPWIGRQPVGIALLILAKVVETFVPSALMAPTATRMIKANMIPYSVVVGPSSDRRNERHRFMNDIM